MKCTGCSFRGSGFCHLAAHNYICNFSSRGLEALFWPLGALSTLVVYRLTCGQNTHKQNKINKEGLRGGGLAKYMGNLVLRPQCQFRAGIWLSGRVLT